MIALGIDCGTQSTKVLAWDGQSGQILAEASAPHHFVPGLPEGAMEQEPREWLAAAETSLRAVLAQLGGRRGEVAAIGVSGQQHGLVALDAAGRPLRPAKLWCDTSTTAECEEITAALGGAAEVVRLVGNTMRTGYTAPKIRWLYKHEPHHYEASAAFLLPHDYLNFWLTGEKRMEYGDASGTALLDVRTRRWSERVCEAVAPGLLERLPAVLSSAQPWGTMRKELADTLGLPRDVLVSAGGGDNMMAAIGTGNVRPGLVTASLGTSGTLFAFAEEPVVDPLGEVAAFCDSTDHWLPLVCTMNVTLVTEHVRKLFGWSHEQMDKAIESVPAGAGGLRLLPYLTGERTPDLPTARGILAGLSLANFTPECLARAAMEGATLGLAYGLERLRALGVEVLSLRLTGGGANSAAWRQMCADVFGVPVVPLDASQGAALGAAIHAVWTLLNHQGQTSCLADLCEQLAAPSHPVILHPRPEASEVYLQALRELEALRGALFATGKK